MKLKTLKRLTTCLLSCVLALSIIVLMPLTARAEGETGDVVCGAGFGSSQSARIEITEDVNTITFHATSLADVNWNTPGYMVIQEDGVVLFNGRSDAWGWGPGFATSDPQLPDGYNYVTEGVPEDWTPWLEANKGDVECTITMQQIDAGHVQVIFSNTGVKSTATIPVTGKAYVVLTGENCTLKNVPLPTPSEDVGGEDVFLDCTGWWAAHTTGFEITTEPHTYTFHSKTYADAFNNWEAPIFVIYHSDDGVVNGGGYREFAVARSDNWGWANGNAENVLPKATESFPEGFDWAVWQAANRGGVDVKVTTQLYNGHVLLGVSNNGVTTTYAIPADLSVTNYLALSGEHCKLSSLQESSSHIDLSGARARADANNAPPAAAAPAPAADPEPAAAPAVETVGGGQVLTGTAWWTGMSVGSNHGMSGDGTWTWTIKASSLIDGYGAFSVEIYDPATNGYITTGSDMNAWTAEGFNPGGAAVSGVAAELASNLVEGHTYTVTVTRSGNTFTFKYKDHTTGNEICTLVITPSETVSNDVQIHVMAQVGSFVTAFNEGTKVATFGSRIGELLSGTAWWTGMAVGSNHLMSGDGTWTWTIKASALVDGYGAFSVEIYDPATNGYITTGSDMNAWTAEGFDPGRSAVSGIPVETTGELVQTAETGGRLVPTAELASRLVEGHTYAVTVTRSGNTVEFVYKDHTAGTEMGTLVVTPGETISKDVQIHVMAQVGTFNTAFSEGLVIVALGDSAQIAIYVIAIIGVAAIIYGSKKRFAR